jgi:phosphomevalonate kinase
LNYLNHTGIIIITLRKNHIIDYFRYFDSLLIIYNKDTTNIENTLADLNSIHPYIQFIIEKETQNKLNYLVLTITSLHKTLTFNINTKEKPSYMEHTTKNKQK